MYPESITQQPHMPLYISNSEDNTQTGSPDKMTLQRLSECIEGGCPDFDQLDAAQKEDYSNDLLKLYLSSIPDPAAEVERLPIPLSNNLLLDIENSGDGMVLAIGDHLAIVENVKIQEIPEIIRQHIIKNVEIFRHTELYAAVSSKDKIHDANKNNKNNEGLIIYINDKIEELQILTDAHPEIKQDCFLVAEYLRSKATDPGNFKLPDSLQQIAEMNLQIDFGCLFSGVEKEVSIGKIAAQTYASVKSKTSLLIRAAEKDLRENVDYLCDYLKNAYPQGCILKVGGSVGHYSYYDVQRDILFSGGKNSYAIGMSGLSLQEYFARKFNSDNIDYKVTLTLTDHDAEEMLDVAGIVSEETGIPREEFLK
ncbi:hypothetical protein [Sodalis sp. dw_96]|uniref:hypothetical protein n=1 Tax=Sodalis sp. dw_96 TaxID=2719794 RepID=UPI001BD44CE4|nr:hypothetical protein [Sodalis sp. dw_96]